MKTLLILPLFAIAALGFAVPGDFGSSTEFVPSATADTPLVSESQRLALVRSARAFLDATSPGERLAAMAPLEGVEQRLRDWSQEHGRAANWSQAEIGSRVVRKAPFTLLPVRGGGVPSSELVLIDGPDGPKVDWEAFVAYQQLAWSSLGEADWSSSVEIRAQVEPAPNHHALFTTAAGYRCFALTHPSTGQRLFAYAQGGAEGPERALWQGYTLPMTLRLSQPPELTGSLEVLVDEWVAVGWSRYRPE